MTRKESWAFAFSILLGLALFLLAGGGITILLIWHDAWYGG